MATIGKTQTSVPVRCPGCGSAFRLPLTMTPGRVRDGAIEMNVRIADEDVVMMRLFIEAHRAGFTR